MSKEKVAELRRSEAKRRREALYRVEILVNPDGTVEVKGFPPNVADALNVMSAGMRAVAGFFIRQATEMGANKAFTGPVQGEKPVGAMMGAEVVQQ